MRAASFAYWRAFLRAAPLGDVVRAAVRRDSCAYWRASVRPARLGVVVGAGGRGVGRRARLRFPRGASGEEARAAAEALAAAPPLFPPPPEIRALHRLLFPCSAARAR